MLSLSKKFQFLLCVVLNWSIFFLDRLSAVFNVIDCRRKSPLASDELDQGKNRNDVTVLTFGIVLNLVGNFMAIIFFLVGPYYSYSAALLLGSYHWNCVNEDSPLVMLGSVAFSCPSLFLGYTSGKLWTQILAKPFLVSSPFTSKSPHSILCHFELLCLFRHRLTVKLSSFSLSSVAVNIRLL